MWPARAGYAVPGWTTSGHKPVFRSGPPFLRPDAPAFVLKIFHGSDTQAFYQKLRGFFTNVRYFKPEASRKESPEIYLINQGFLPKK